MTLKSIDSWLHGKAYHFLLDPFGINPGHWGFIFYLTGLILRTHVQPHTCRQGKARERSDENVLRSKVKSCANDPMPWRQLEHHSFNNKKLGRK